MGGEDTILVVGVSHHTAPLAARERVALDDAGARAVLRELRAVPALHEAVVLSTCNRTEIYAVAGAPEPGERALRALLARRTSLGAATLTCAAYARFDQEAVEHLFRVAAGLESAILGETEIVGQVRGAARRAEQEGTAGPVLARAFADALAAGRRVRRRTGISVGATSVCSVVADLVAAGPHPRGARRVVLVGAGRLAHSLAGALGGVAAAELVVVNRTAAAADAIAARAGAASAGLDRLGEELRRADAVVCATSAPHAVISAADLEAALAGRPRPLTVVDLAVPRDVEPAAAAVPGVVVHDIDAVQRLVAANLAARRREARVAAELIRHEAGRFDAWRRERDAASAVRAVWREAERLRRAELGRVDDGLTAQERELLDRVTGSLVRKLLQGPSERLLQACASAPAAAHIESFRLLFDVPSGGGADPASAPSVAALRTKRPVDAAERDLAHDHDDRGGGQRQERVRDGQAQQAAGEQELQRERDGAGQQRRRLPRVAAAA